MKTFSKAFYFPLLFLSLLFISIFASAADYVCANPKAFSLRTNYVIPGDLIAIGNSNVCADTDNNGECDANQIQRNDTNNIIFIDSNSSAAVSSEPDSLESTTAANLSLPTGAIVKWAGLYWQGEVWDINLNNVSRLSKDGTAIENGADGQARQAIANTIKLKLPGGAYQDITADEHHYFFVKKNTGYNEGYKGIPRYEMHYQSFKDITSQVQALTNSGNGDYWVANIQATVGRLKYPGVEAAWSLQVIYEYPGAEPRSIAINDGYLGLYSSANDGVNYVNEVNSLYGLGCSTDYEDSGVYAYDVSFNISGFITPKEAGFNTDMTIFVTESDPDGSQYDSSLPEELTVTKADGSISTVDGPALGVTDAWAYEITDKNGSDNLNRTPAYIYPIGMTIKNYAKTDLLSPDQTSTTVKFSTDSDRLILGVIGFATDLRKPKLCYDYAYSQYGRYFTEDYNQTAGPHLSGTVRRGEPIEVKLYIKNEENSDIEAESMFVHVLDINTSQAEYIPGSTQVTYPNSIVQTPISDAILDVATDNSYVKDIPIGSVDSLEYFYTYYQLDPSTLTINIPINARVDYNITLDAGGVDITIPYQVYLNSEIGICTGSTTYAPAKGIFNVVHNDYNTSLSSGYFYNLPTQITSREGNFRILSMDPDNLDNLQPVSTIVGVDLIDASAFHDTNASCQEQSSSISERVWVTFENNATSTLFNQTTLQTAISTGMTDLTSSSDFYSIAKENVAFRVSFNLADDNGTIKTKTLANGKTQLENFTSVAGNPCAPSFTGNGTISSNCGSNGTGAGTGMSPSELKTCMECIFGLKTKVVCSRDNFSIRPEAFLINIDDQNQTNSSVQSRLTTNYSGVASATAHEIHIAAGYKYNIEVNATNHIDNNSSYGYVKFLSADEAQHSWTGTGSSCDDSNKSISLSLIQGKEDTNTSINNVGKYGLNITDKTWTDVDNGTSSSHQTGSFFHPTRLDCVLNSSDTQIVNSGTNNGCEISSDHTNPSNSIVYNDYNFTVHPYDFNLTIDPRVGISTPPSPVNTNSYVYMADMSFNSGQDENMSYHLNGNIDAKGYNGDTVSNFVNNCYAEPLDISIVKSDTTLNDTNGNPIVYQYRFHDVNTSGVITALDIDGNNTPPTAPIVIQTTESYFTTSSPGVMVTRLNLNYNREINTTVNPTTVSFTSYDVNCTNPATDCTFNADLVNNKTTQGTKDLNSSIAIKHYYGRTHAPRQRFVTPKGTAGDPADAFIYYEVYCEGAGCNNRALLQAEQAGLSSKYTDDPRWFKNEDHNVSDFGNAGTVTQKSAANVTATAPYDNTTDGQTKIPLIYNASRGYTYKATMNNRAPGWLIYNQFNGDATTVLNNEFEVEFVSGSRSWAGEHDDNTNTTRSDASTKTNRRSMW